jgi:hypothetical protein
MLVYAKVGWVRNHKIFSLNPLIQKNETLQVVLVLGHLGENALSSGKIPDVQPSLEVSQQMNGGRKPEADAFWKSGEKCFKLNWPCRFKISRYDYGSCRGIGGPLPDRPE